MSELDYESVPKMKVTDLRSALEDAGLDAKGTKPILVARLQSYIESQNGAAGNGKPEPMEGVSTEPESAKHKLAAEESSTPAAKKAKFDGENGENGMMLDEVKVERVKNCWNCEQVGHMQKECPEPQKPVEGADCEFCKIFVKKIHSEFHYNGARHAKNVKRASAPPPVPYDCTICNVTIIGEVPYNAHLEGKKHKKKVESPNAPAPAPFDCAICNVTITGEAQYNAHLEGKKHKKKLENPNKSSENQSTKFQCELCSVEILGEDQYKKHLEGKKHKATLDKTQNPVPTQQFRCEVCNVEVQNEGQYTSHMEGKKHKKKLEGPKTPQQAAAPGAPGVAVAPAPPGVAAPAPVPYECTICNVTITGEAQYNAHLEGKKHKGKLEKPQNQGQFQCDFCQVTIMGEDQYNAHLVGKKHKKKVMDGSIASNLGSIRNQAPMMQGPGHSAPAMMTY